jgi:hypothetical protein
MLLDDEDRVMEEEDDVAVEPRDSISSVPVRGRLYCAMSRLTVAGELPEFVPLANTVEPESISAVSPADTFWTATAFVIVS